MYLNKAFLYGNLTRDPEVRALPSGAQVASFALATNRTFKDRDGNKQEAVEFHNIVAFGKLAEIISQYAKKGRPLFVEGRIQTRSWETDGKKNYRTEIVVDNFQFGPGGGGEGGTGGGYARTSDSGSAPRAEAPSKAASEDAIAYPQEDINPDDIPF